MPANSEARVTISISIKKKRRFRDACKKSHLVLDVYVRLVWVSPLPSKRTQTAVHRVSEMYKAASDIAIRDFPWQTPAHLWPSSAPLFQQS